jgi:hypothetical protein
VVSCRGEAGGAAVEIVLEGLHQRGFDRDSAVLSALAADVHDGAVGGAPNVTDVGTQQFVGTQPGKEPGKDECSVAFDPIAVSPRLWVRDEGSQRVIRRRMAPNESRPVCPARASPKQR